MTSENDSTVAARVGVNGSSERCASPPSEAEQSLHAAIRNLVQQIGETNAHLMILSDQTARCLAHIALLVDLLLSDEDESDTDTMTYLDGRPIL
jgi:hypothetical protein